MRATTLSQTMAGLLLLAGCGPGHDPLDAPIAWWHHLQGGAIAEQRPPPPGVDAPYPLVGTTPPRPKVTSAAARDALTASLIDQQNASHQFDTRDPIIVTAPPASAKPATPPSTATLDAAGTPDPNAPPPPPRPTPTVEQQESGEPLLAMPPPPPAAVTVVAGPLPQMPAAPPAPPAFPGFDIPATPLKPVRPDLAGPAQLSNLDFQPGSDVLLPSARGALQHAASARLGAPVEIRGYGEARSDTPDAQAAGLRLALARAASAAEALEALGVPSASIVVAADAFGRGGTVSVVH